MPQSLVNKPVWPLYSIKCMSLPLVCGMSRLVCCRQNDWLQEQEELDSTSQQPSCCLHVGLLNIKLASSCLQPHLAVLHTPVLLCIVCAALFPPCHQLLHTPYVQTKPNPTATAHKPALPYTTLHPAPVHGTARGCCRQYTYVTIQYSG